MLCLLLQAVLEHGCAPFSRQAGLEDEDGSTSLQQLRSTSSSKQAAGNSSSPWTSLAAAS